MARMFANCPGNQGSISARVIPKPKKWYLMPPCFTLIPLRYGSRLSVIIQGNEYRPF